MTEEQGNSTRSGNGGAGARQDPWTRQSRPLSPVTGPLAALLQWHWADKISTAKEIELIASLASLDQDAMRATLGPHLTAHSTHQYGPNQSNHSLDAVMKSLLGTAWKPPQRAVQVFCRWRSVPTTKLPVRPASCVLHSASMIRCLFR